MDLQSIFTNIDLCLLGLVLSVGCGFFFGVKTVGIRRDKDRHEKGYFPLLVVNGLLTMFAMCVFVLSLLMLIE